MYRITITSPLRYAVEQIVCSLSWIDTDILLQRLSIALRPGWYLRVYDAEGLCIYDQRNQ